MKYAIQGMYAGRELLWVESKPERCVLHGTMGDYGYTPKQANALLFDSKKTAEWHAARVYGFDGHRGCVVEVKP